MQNSIINELAEIFKRFPGIGPRQAKRFVYFLLQQDTTLHHRLTKLIAELPRLVSVCPDCRRFFQDGHEADDSRSCPICLDQHRRNGQLLVIEKDADLEAIEKAGTYLGQYFVLGGLVPILEKEPEKKIRIASLIKQIEKLASANQLSEVILAFAVTTEADHTIEYLKERLTGLVEKYHFQFTLLGRGLSGGLEIEYSDPDTLKNALSNRH